jgi:hypothetical protein
MILGLLDGKDRDLLAAADRADRHSNSRRTKSTIRAPIDDSCSNDDDATQQGRVSEGEGIHTKDQTRQTTRTLT